MDNPFIGSIVLFAGNFAPKNWAFCNGQILSIQSNTALFSILGTTYGGNGVQTFALPDLRGRVPVSSGQAPGLSAYTLGEQGGSEAYTLLQTNMPQHNHLLNGTNATNGAEAPGPNHVLGLSPMDKMYAAAAPNTSLSTSSIGMAGGSQPFPLMQPYLALNYIIALYGIFPTRN